MIKQNRRNFLKLMGAGGLALSMPGALMAAPSYRVLVVGGGYAGSTCAKYLKLWGGESVEVVLVDPSAAFVSPVLSNLVLNNQRSVADLTFAHAELAKYGVVFLQKAATAIDAAARRVTFHDGTTLTYDRLVLAPGIDFAYPNAYDTRKVPHAWIAGEQTVLLKNQIDTLRDGDTFVLTIPGSPYRCPPGPYERACVVADYLKNGKGLNVNIVVLDQNGDIVVEKNSFAARFAMYGIDYRPGSTVTYVDDGAMTVTYTRNGATEQVGGKVINVIPNQRAAQIVFDAGLVEGNFAPVNLISYESTRKPYIHIIGDSHASGQPKAGHIANSEAKICADAVLRLLSGLSPYGAPKTNSACYSPVSATEATWLSAVYAYDPGSNSMIMTSFGSGAPSTRNYADMFNWSGNLFYDTFL